MHREWKTGQVDRDYRFSFLIYLDPEHMSIKLLEIEKYIFTEHLVDPNHCERP